jgi:hypothetical protein
MFYVQWTSDPIDTGPGSCRGVAREGHAAQEVRTIERAFYRELRNDAGDSPTQIRIASDELLRREAGEDALRRAAADLWSRAQDVALGRDDVDAGARPRSV